MILLSRAILTDPEKYPDPSTFSPERFLTSRGELDPNAPDIEAAFSYGRRSCPGKYMALDALWIVATSVVWAFDLSKAKDTNGRDIEISGEYNIGLVR